jgi:hypothetical protein
MSSHSQQLPAFENHCSLRGSRFVLVPLVLVHLLLSATSLHAQTPQTCPWLNAATASGAVGGGPVTVSVTPKGDQGDADCLFVRHVGSSTIALRIKVETMNGPSFSLESYTAQCRSALTPVRAIGNEAFACSLPSEKKTGLSEQITSRVRERAFFIRLSSNDPSADSEELRLIANKLAQQVAGFLF